MFLIFHIVLIIGSVLQCTAIRCESYLKFNTSEHVPWSESLNASMKTYISPSLPVAEVKQDNFYGFIIFYWNTFPHFEDMYLKLT